MIIAIDGPAASGKSTSAKLLAKELGYLYLDGMQRTYYGTSESHLQFFLMEESLLLVVT